MSALGNLQQPVHLSFNREVSLALELLDAVTLHRISQSVSVVADGFRSAPIRNASGIYVWLGEDVTQLRSIVVNTGRLPLEGAVLLPTAVNQPLTTLQLAPRIDYPFTTGVTGLRASLVELPVFGATRAEPVSQAKVNLSWLDEDGAWQASNVISTTDTSGDFVSIARFAPSQKPAVAADGTITVRLSARREGWSARTSRLLKLAPGVITNPMTAEPLIFVWNELLP